MLLGGGQLQRLHLQSSKASHVHLHPGRSALIKAATSDKGMPLALRAEKTSSLPPWKSEAALPRYLLQAQLIPNQLLCRLALLRGYAFCAWDTCLELWI